MPEVLAQGDQSSKMGRRGKCADIQDEYEMGALDFEGVLEDLGKRLVHNHPHTIWQSLTQAATVLKHHIP